MTVSRRSIVAVLSAVALGASAARASAAPCDSLTSLSLPKEIIVTSAQVVAAGAFTLPAPPAGNAPNFRDVPEFCRVTATAKPSGDSNIGIEVWLPAAGWNGKFQPVGNGLWGGAFNYAGLANMVRAGYATAGSDTGHSGAGASFALGHPEKLKDFAYRAFHESMIVARAAVPAFYGKQPSLSLVDQCGGAGRTALAEVQRYPEEFDVIAASGLDTESTRHAMGQLWVWQAAHKTPQSAIPAAKLPALHQAALDACDANDGLKDGVIGDPLHCKFDPGVIECKGADGPTCLTSAQVETARTVYTPVTNPRTKKVLFGPLLPGGELGWGQQTGDQPFSYGTDLFRYLVFKDPTWHPAQRPVDFDKDAAVADSAENQIVNVDPDLSKFITRGGKLLFVGGWADGAIAPASNTDYYEAVVKTVGAKARDAVRLFMVPDMGHCPAAPNAANGYAIDTLGLVEQWRTTGKAPDSIIVSHRTNGVEDRKMLVCKYPEVAVYNGSGDPKAPASFSCRAR
ncbi:MAG: hypothetical protein A3G76_04420 [Acidobacteria bacterium RIFCSPLOWO2_12_FULL_65_11]|nr:MAG: hypothetical protein A3G76_04420 [Acidobacteria bacterium RIFCSPLOWO2_12_FULL_65_11]